MIQTIINWFMTYVSWIVVEPFWTIIGTVATGALVGYIIYCVRNR